MSNSDADFDDIPPPPPSSNHTIKSPNIAGGLVMAFSYLSFIVLVLYLFKRYYNSGKGKNGPESENWLGRHAEKEEYQRLCQLDSTDDDTLRKALMKRVMADVRRMWKLNDERDSVNQLMKNGALSEKIWNAFKQAEKEMEIEFIEVQAEAETFKDGWSQTIIKEAVDFCRLDMFRQQQLKSREEQEKQTKDDQRRSKQKDHEKRIKKEQEERARIMTEKYLSQLTANK